MRLILVGCEYTGKSTLARALAAWGREHGKRFHLDDHFTIPDQQMVREEEQQAMLAAPPALKERFQRFQIYYHLRLLHVYDDIILVGFHIEEAVYGPRYYYPGRPLSQMYHRQIETEMPRDTLLVLLTAAPEVIRARLARDPHKHPVVAAPDVEEVQRQFEAEFAQSWLKRRVRLDTTALQPGQIVGAFLERVLPELNERDLLFLQALRAKGAMP